MSVIPYALEQLYVDQDHDWVIDAIPAVIAWVPQGPKKNTKPPYRFPVEHVGRSTTSHELELTWSIDALREHDPAVEAKAKRYRSGRSVVAEDLTEVAAYGLALVATSVLMPGRRVRERGLWVAPDLLFDATPGALRGVEVAGRSTGGHSELSRVANAKRPLLLDRGDIAEVHLSLWSGSARYSVMEQVKP